uniref:PHD-type domain-containing protein n=1 Tax=Anopheles atroparvus TaxID=41427 RepID=A0A182J8S5_ANOAO
MKEMVGGCCVCSDDRGWSENPLVYCDGQSCAVAVHQACYGIVTVPSGPWYCRKCESQERSARVRCELCPSRDGALKRTDNQGWAHVVCALYIPEVRFGNVTTMEPIILQLIPQERYNKTCYICQEAGKGSRATVGACMQCNKSGCKQQFHVTCAQQLGLLCEEAGNYLDNVKYCGYCQHHYSKLKKGGNVKTIPPYKPISHEANSSDGPSSPEKDMEPPPPQQHSGGGGGAASSGSGTGGGGGGGGSSSGTGGPKSNSRLSGGEPPMGGSSSTSSSSSSSSKQRKSSSASKSSSGGSSSNASSSAASSSVLASSGSASGSGAGLAGSSAMSSTSSSTSGISSMSGSGSGGSGTGGGSGMGSSGISGSASSSGSSKGNSGSSGGASGSGGGSSSSKEKDKYSKSVSIFCTISYLLPSGGGSSGKHHSDKSDKGGTGQGGSLTALSAASGSSRAASLSPAAIPTTLIIKPPQDHSGAAGKEQLSKEAIAKMSTSSNFTETIVVNSESVYSHGGSGGPSGGPGSTSVIEGGKMAMGQQGGAGTTLSGSYGGSSGNSGGGSASGGGGGGKKRKADARSTPTSAVVNNDMDINRDLIKDVAVSIVPLSLSKNDHMDTSSSSSIGGGHEKSVKKNTT